MAPDLGSDRDLTDEAVGLGSVGKVLGAAHGRKWRQVGKPRNEKR